MKTSETVKEIFSALVKAQAEFPTVKKDATNPHFKSRYAELSSFVEAAKPILRKYGLGVTQLLDSENSNTVTIYTMLIHESGEWIQSKYVTEPTKKDPQGYGSAITYGRRYSYASILGMVSDEDDDGNDASGLNHNQKPKPEQKKPESPKKDFTEILKKTWAQFQSDPTVTTLNAIMESLKLYGVPNETIQKYEVKAKDYMSSIPEPVRQETEGEEVVSYIKANGWRAAYDNIQNFKGSQQDILDVITESAISELKDVTSSLEKPEEFNEAMRVIGTDMPTPIKKVFFGMLKELAFQKDIAYNAKEKKFDAI